jgi:hypothetical protein
MVSRRVWDVIPVRKKQKSEKSVVNWGNCGGKGLFFLQKRKIHWDMGFVSKGRLEAKEKRL